MKLRLKRKKQMHLEFRGGPLDGITFKTDYNSALYGKRILVDGWPYRAGIGIGNNRYTIIPYYEEHEHASKRIEKEKAEIHAREKLHGIDTSNSVSGCCHGTVCPCNS